jgi:hypothetical protein
LAEQPSRLRLLRYSDRLEILVIVVLGVWMATAIFAQSQDAINATLTEKVSDALRRIGHLEEQQNRVIWGILGLLGFKVWDIFERKRTRGVHVKQWTR